MIEMNWWIALILLAGSVLVAFLAFVAVACVYSIATGNAVNVKLPGGYLKIDVGDDT